MVRAADGALMVTRYADCLSVTRDPRFAHLPPEMLATNPLANGLVALLELASSLDGVESLRPLYESPELAVEELLRYDCPVQLVPRVTTDPVELGGVAIGAGEQVVAYLGAGNRDPRRFSDPDRLVLDRADNTPLSFGGGIHYCLGAPLARLEARVALPALLRRYPRLVLTAVPYDPTPLPSKGFRAFRYRRAERRGSSEEEDLTVHIGRHGQEMLISDENLSLLSLCADHTWSNIHTGSLRKTRHPLSLLPVSKRKEHDEQD